MRLRRRLAPLGNTADRAAFQTLHTATLMTGALRGGLSAESAGESVRHVRSLLPATAAALTDTQGLLAWDGAGETAHAAGAAELASRVILDGGTSVHDHRSFNCEAAGCPLRKAVVCPLVVQDTVVGTLQVFAESTSASLVRAATEVAAWISSQLELAERDTSRTRLMEAEVRAMRAQISPHFVYNALNAIASFVRTDPDRARELLLDFADFSRYSL
ncbi:MAG: histidine kinase, partial [Actinomycetota bacterium]|nr:histidine kinase [Actinomycetota bacterium]